MSADPVKEAVERLVNLSAGNKSWAKHAATPQQSYDLREDAKAIDTLLSALQAAEGALGQKTRAYDDAMEKWSADVAEFAPYKDKFQAAEAENERLRLAHLRPGVMRCAKCEFRLIRNVLYAQSGNIGAGTSETEPCPNGCGPLWPVTWKDECQAADKLWDQQVERAVAAEAERDAARERERALEEEINLSMSEISALRADLDRALTPENSHEQG